MTKKEKQEREQKLMKLEKSLSMKFLDLRNDFVFTKNEDEENEQINKIKEILDELHPIQEELKIMINCEKEGRFKNIIDMCREDKKNFLLRYKNEKKLENFE